jgi:formylmethanofuran dehydrogenase subunit E
MKESSIMRKTQTYFEQIPVEKVKEMLAHLPESRELRPPVSASIHHVLRCTICHEPVPVETAKTDSNGKAIHEECYMISMAGKTVTSRGSNPSV